MEAVRLVVLLLMCAGTAGADCEVTIGRPAQSSTSAAKHVLQCEQQRPQQRQADLVCEQLSNDGHASEAISACLRASLAQLKQADLAHGRALVQQGADPAEVSKEFGLELEETASVGSAPPALLDEQREQRVAAELAERAAAVRESAAK